MKSLSVLRVLGRSGGVATRLVVGLLLGLPGVAAGSGVEPVGAEFSGELVHRVLCGAAGGCRRSRRAVDRPLRRRCARPHLGTVVRRGGRPHRRGVCRQHARRHRPGRLLRRGWPAGRRLVRSEGGRRRRLPGPAVRRRGKPGGSDLPDQLDHAGIPDGSRRRRQRRRRVSRHLVVERERRRLRAALLEQRDQAGNAVPGPQSRLEPDLRLRRRARLERLRRRLGGRSPTATGRSAASSAAASPARAAFSAASSRSARIPWTIKALPKSPALRVAAS